MITQMALHRAMNPVRATIQYFVLGWALLGVSVTPSVAQDDGIHYAGSDAELVLSRVSGRTVEVQVSPIGADGEALQPPASNILVDYPRDEVWSGRAASGSVERSVGALTVEVDRDPLAVTVRRADSSVVQRVSWPESSGAMHFRTEGPVFGLGQGGPQFDRRGNRYSMEDGWGAFRRPTHGSRVATPMLIGMDGWALFVHHPMSEKNAFDLRAGHGEFEPGEQARTRPLKFFLISWEDPADVFEEYTQIAGDTPMPPKWTLGYMQSHRTLDGPEQIREVAQTFREKNLPADALIYLGRFTPRGWNTEEHPWQFNPETFTNPEAIIRDLHALNFKVVPHTYGGPEGLHGTSMDAAPTDSNHIANYWQHHEALVETGVDAWWPDGGERLSSEGRVARHRMYRLGPLSEEPNERPWSFHRTGYSGAHRYGGWMWSGDVDSYWKTLETQIAVGLNHTVSLTPFWGSDTGGFLPSVELTGELYTRWFQFSAFCASFRSHGRAWHLRLPWGWNTANLGPPEVDAFSDAFEHGYPRPNELRNGLVEPIARKYLHLRYRLLPYNYTLVRRTHETGLPPMRAMWLHYPNDSMAVRQDDQYLWGRNLLVAPVHTKGASHRTLYLPEGTWYDFWTNEQRSGGQEVTRQVDLATMPIYVRSGTILPMAPVRQHVGQAVNEPYTLRIYPGRDGSFRWYRDDGKTLDHRAGEYSWTRLRWDESARRLVIEPGPESEGQAPPPTSFRVKVMGVGATGENTKTVDWDGSRAEITFEPMRE